MPSMKSVKQIVLLSASYALLVSYGLQINHSFNRRRSLWKAPHDASLFKSTTYTRSLTSLRSTTDEGQTNDEALLAEVDISTLQNLCSQYSLSESGSKIELLARLRDYANTQAEKDRIQRQGRKQRVENNLEGKARHTFIDEPWTEEDDDDMGGYFYFDAETKDEKKEREQKQKEQQREQKIKSQPITAPPNLENVKPNEKGERVVTVYSTTDNNDLTGMKASEMSMEAMGQKPLRTNMPEDSLIGGVFGDQSGSKRKKADDKQLEKAKENVLRLVGDLLATTGAPAFQDDYDEGDGEAGSNPYATPYGFVGFQSERIPPDTLVDSSYALRMQNGRALHEVLEEYELQAIGYDGMAADDKEKGGGHYQEVQKVRSFLEGFRTSEERRVARETSTMLLDRLVKEGVSGLDEMLAAMPKEGDDTSHMLGVNGGEAGMLDSALLRYLDEAIRDQEQRVERIKTPRNDGLLNSGMSLDDDDDSMWNVTRGEDGTTIETVDLNDPLLREQLEKSQDQFNQNRADNLASLTVQEKMLLLLKLLRDRVKVEAIMGSNVQAKNLKVLAYCLKAGSDDERRKFILGELGSSLDALDIFADLVSSSIDYTEARSNDNFMPGQSKKSLPPLLNLSKLRSIKELVVEIKSSQQWKASGVSNSKPPVNVNDLINKKIEDIM